MKTLSPLRSPALPASVPLSAADLSALPAGFEVELSVMILGRPSVWRASLLGRSLFSASGVRISGAGEIRSDSGSLVLYRNGVRLPVAVSAPL